MCPQLSKSTSCRRIHLPQRVDVAVPREEDEQPSVPAALMRLINRATVPPLGHCTFCAAGQGSMAWHFVFLRPSEAQLPCAEQAQLDKHNNRLRLKDYLRNRIPSRGRTRGAGMREPPAHAQPASGHAPSSRRRPGRAAPPPPTAAHQAARRTCAARPWSPDMQLPYYLNRRFTDCAGCCLSTWTSDCLETSHTV